jgi:hypothetical protein
MGKNQWGFFRRKTETRTQQERSRRSFAPSRTQETETQRKPLISSRGRRCSVTQNGFKQKAHASIFYLRPDFPVVDLARQITGDSPNFPQCAYALLPCVQQALWFIPEWRRGKGDIGKDRPESAA